MKQRIALAGFFVALVSANAQLPIPNPAIAPFGIANAATSGRFSRNTAELARGGIFVVRGAWLGPDDVTLSQSRTIDIAGSRIEIRSIENGQVFSAQMIHAWNFQVAGILPLEMPAGPAELTAIYRDGRSEPAEIIVVDSAPGLFTVSQQGFGPGVIQNFVSPTEQPLNALTNPALPGQYVILWGTGLGEAQDVRIVVGEKFIEPSYAGPAPGLPGVDQYNVPLPDDAELLRRCYVPVSVANGTRVGRPVTMSIADRTGACEHPWGLSPETLEALDAGQRLKTLRAFIGDNDFLGPLPGPRPLTSRSISAVATLELANATGVALNSPVSSQPDRVRTVFCGSVLGNQIVGAIFDPGITLPQPPPPPNPPTVAADAGEKIEFVGPNGRTLTLARMSAAPLATDPYQFIQPGEVEPLASGGWSINAPGGVDIEGFSEGFDLPPIPAVAIPTSIDFEQDITIEWSGQAYQPQDIVRLTVGVWVRDEGEPSRFTLHGGSCTVPATNGALTIDRRYVANLPEPANDIAAWSLFMSAPRNLELPQLDRAVVTYSASRSAEPTID